MKPAEQTALRDIFFPKPIDTEKQRFIIELHFIRSEKIE